MSKIRVGLLGLGNRGRCMLTTIVKCFKNVEIVAVCDPYPERAEEGVEIVRVFGGYEPYMTLNSDDVITRDDIDTIMIFTSWEAHVDLAIQAMRAGKKVAMEIFNIYPGYWEVEPIENSESAYNFWKKTIEEYTSNDFEIKGEKIFIFNK